MLWYVMFLVVVFALGFFYGHGARSDTDDNDEDINIDFFKLCEIIEDMNSTKNKLKQIDRLILDLELADENNTQTINLQWQDMSKEDNHYSVEVKNSDNFLIKEMKNEQKRLRSHLLDCINEIDVLRSPLNGEQTLKGSDEK